MKMIKPFLLLLTAVAIAWIFLPSSQEKYLWFKGGSAKLAGEKVSFEVVISDYYSDTQTMDGVVYIHYKRKTFYSTNCELSASVNGDGFDPEKEPNLSSSNPYISKCNSNEDECRSHLAPGPNGRIHLEFSKVPVSEIEVTLSVTARDVDNTSRCESQSVTVKRKPTFKRASKWDYFYSR